MITKQGDIGMFGIRFIVPNIYGQIIHDLVQNLNTSDYHWHVTYEDILVPPIQEDGKLFAKKDLCDADFKRQILTSEYYVIFLSIAAFPKKSQSHDIHSFSEYFHGDCQLMIFITDAIFVDIYCKDREFIQIFKTTATKNCTKI